MARNIFKDYAPLIGTLFRLPLRFDLKFPLLLVSMTLLYEWSAPYRYQVFHLRISVSLTYWDNYNTLRREMAMWSYPNIDIVKVYNWLDMRSDLFDLVISTCQSSSESQILLMFSLKNIFLWKFTIYVEGINNYQEMRTLLIECVGIIFFSILVYENESRLEWYTNLSIVNECHGKWKCLIQ